MAEECLLRIGEEPIEGLGGGFERWKGSLLIEMLAKLVGERPEARRVGFELGKQDSYAEAGLEAVSYLLLSEALPQVEC